MHRKAAYGLAALVTAKPSHRELTLAGQGHFLQLSEASESAPHSWGGEGAPLQFAASLGTQAVGCAVRELWWLKPWREHTGAVSLLLGPLQWSLR